MKNKNKSNLIAESNSGLLLGEISSKNISAQVLDSDEVFESYFEDAKNLTAEVVGSEVIGFVEGDTITGEVQLSIGDFEFIKGPIGKAGPEGKGVPAGGNDGDVLVKVGQENYVTRWERPRFGGGGRQSSSPSGSSNYTGASPTTVTVGAFQQVRQLRDCQFQTYSKTFWSRTFRPRSVLFLSVNPVLSRSVLPFQDSKTFLSGSVILET